MFSDQPNELGTGARTLDHNYKESDVRKVLGDPEFAYGRQTHVYLWSGDIRSHPFGTVNILSDELWDATIHVNDADNTWHGRDVALERLLAEEEEIERRTAPVMPPGMYWDGHGGREVT